MCVIDERTEQFVVTRAGFVRSRNNRIDDAKMRVRTDALRGDPCARTNRSADQRAVFERAHDGCADRNNASTVVFRTADRSRGHGRYPIRLVERQPPIERFVRETVVTAEPTFSLDELAILLCDVVGPWTTDVAGTRPRSADEGRDSAVATAGPGSAIILVRDIPGGVRQLGFTPDGRSLIAALGAPSGGVVVFEAVRK